MLTALSVAGVLGPTLVNYLREGWIAQGYSKNHAYDATLYIMAVFLGLGCFCNRAVGNPGLLAPEETSPASPLAGEGLEGRPGS